MITLELPHMGLNDSRAPASARMWNTWKISQTETREHILDWVATVARGAPGGWLKHVVFSCHGNSSYLQMGVGFDRTHTPLFKRWGGLVDRIWFRACLVAHLDTPGSAAARDGNVFCSEVARAAQCYVVAPRAEQVNGSLIFSKIVKLPDLPSEAVLAELQWLSRLFLGTVFIVSGVLKVRYRARFRDTVSALELGAPRLASQVARLLPPLEIVLGSSV